MSSDEIMINCFGRLEATTAGIYYQQIKELIETIENRHAFNIKDYMIFCDPIVEEYAKQIAKYYKIEYKSSLFLPKDTVFILADKNIFKPNYETLEDYMRREKKDDRSRRIWQNK